MNNEYKFRSMVTSGRKKPGDHMAADVLVLLLSAFIRDIYFVIMLPVLNI